MAKFEHLTPADLAETCRVLAQHGDDARIIAGGTDIIVRLKQRLVEPRYLVDVKRAGGLDAVAMDGDNIRIGAAVTLTDLQRSSAVRERAPLLAEAAAAVGATQLQNMGTIGGNICLDTRCWYYQQTPAWRAARPACFKLGGEICYMAKGSDRCYALYSGDMAAALLALGASVRLVSARGERTMPLADFFVDDGRKATVLERDELLAEVIVPMQAEGQRGAYLKFRRREAIDFPIAGVAALVLFDNDFCRQACIAVTGVGSAPFVVADSEMVLAGGRMSESLIDEAAEAAYRQVRPVSHMEVSAAYRKRLVRVLVKDALGKLS